MAMFLNSVLAIALGVTLSIASGDNSTNITSTTMISSSTDASSTTTDATVETGSRIVVSGCSELGGAIDQLVDSQDAATAFGKAIASVAQVPQEYVQNVVFTAGATCGGRRLGERRLQTTGTVTFDLVFPASLATVAAQQAAEAAITNWGTANAEAFAQALQTELAAVGITATITVTNLGTLVTIESGGTTATTTAAEEESPADAACQTSMALGFLLALTQLV